MQYSVGWRAEESLAYSRWVVSAASGPKIAEPCVLGTEPGSVKAVWSRREDSILG